MAKGKRKTTEEFIAAARKVHGDRYQYIQTDYVHSSKKVIITCPVHGDFEQEAGSHIKGRGCPECVYDKKRMDTQSFIRAAIRVHGELYNYHQVVYHSSKKKVIITCPVHGDFEQIPNNHLNGKGCPGCRSGKIGDKKRSNKESFIRSAVQVHGQKYIYDKVIYKSAFKKVIITCPVHGDFEQIPNSHLCGRGCTKCVDTWSGDGVVYVMSSPEGYNKIGIVKAGTEHNRLSQILKSQQTKAPAAITGLSMVCAYSFNDGSFTEARKFEGKAHRHFKLRRKAFADKFDGSSEFFNVTVTEICSYLEQQGGKLVTIKQ